MLALDYEVLVAEESETARRNKLAVAQLLQTKRGAYAIIATAADGTERLMEIAGFHTAGEAELIAVSWQLANMVAGRKFRARLATPQEIEARKQRK